MDVLGTDYQQQPKRDLHERRWVDICPGDVENCVCAFDVSTLEHWIDAHLKALVAEGYKEVIIQPIGFVCDHVEVLYDIDIAFQQTARELGLKLWRAESLNDSPLLIEALDHVACGDLAVTHLA